MGYWKNKTVLEIVEALAEYADEICQEEQLSEMFDQDIAPDVIEGDGQNDAPAMRQAFNDWTDGLCKDGVIHESQYNAYSYVGKWGDAD